MKSEHKSKKRGRSSSPAKKKLKRKYRNDRSKKCHQSSSESSSSEEDASLTSDEYPSSAEEKRKEAKKKRSKKVKRKPRASVSSSRSPSPEKVKKKTKLKDDKDDIRKDRHRKERRSPSSKKKRKQSRSGSGSSGSRQRSPIKKEKSKKKHSPSPSPTQVKKKRSVSPPAKKEGDRIEKKKKKASISPARSRKKSSRSPSRKEKQSPSPAPTREKKAKSPTHRANRRKSISLSPSRTKQKSVSPPPSKHRPKSPISLPKSRNESVSPLPRKEKKRLPVARTSKSPTNYRRKKSRSPAPRMKSKSPSPSRPQRENRNLFLKVKSKSPSPSRLKLDSQSLAHRKKSLTPPAQPEKKAKSPRPPILPVKKAKSPRPPILPEKKAKSPRPPILPEKKAKSPPVIQPEKKAKIPPVLPEKKSKIPPVLPEKKAKITPVLPEKKAKIPPVLPENRAKSPPAIQPEKKAKSPPEVQPEKKTKSPPEVQPEKKTKIPPVLPEKKAKIPPVLPENRAKSPPAIQPEKKAKSPPEVQPEKITISPPVLPDKIAKIPPVIQPEIKAKSPPPTLRTAKSASPISAKAVLEQVMNKSPSAKPEATESHPAVVESKLKATVPIILNTKSDISIPFLQTKKDLLKPNDPKESDNAFPDKIKMISETPAFRTKVPLHIVSEMKINNPITKEHSLTVASVFSKKSKSPSRDLKNGVSPFGIKKNSTVSIKKSYSPTRSSKKSASPSSVRVRKKSQSPSPTRIRRRSKSPKRERKRSRSPAARHRKDDRGKSPSKQKRRSRSRSGSPSRSRKDRDKSPDKDSKKRKNEEKRKDDDRERVSGRGDERSADKKERDDKDKSKRHDDHRRSRDERGSKDDRRKKDEKEQKVNKRDKSPEKKNINELEDEMKKRKERIEAWRNANRKKGGGTPGGEMTDDGLESEKKWSLEDDEDEEEQEDEELSVEGKQGNADKKEEESSVKPTKRNKPPKEDIKKEQVKEEEDKIDEDCDPLDSFMKGIDDEVNKISGRNTSKPIGGAKAKTITIVKTVVNKAEEEKPEVMEQNQDALEYSSEEEPAKDIKASDFTDVTKKKKELTVADHSKIYYAPFRKEFYVEVPELTRMSMDEVKLLRDTLGDIQVRGKNIPKPIKSWAQAGLSSRVMNILKKCQYEKPTPIQAQTLPIAMSGRDMIGIAKTGSGKTLAFVLPMLRHVLDQPALDEDDGPIAIIMTPTRELAIQIYRESKKFCKALNLQVTCIYGGSGISEQISELKKGTEMIVCTPGRMIDMLAANNGRVTNCRRCTYLVLDEADRMFDMGFEPQVMRIIDNIRPDRQTVLFSATFPRQMEAMARKVLTKPIEVQVGGRSIVCSDVEQHAIAIEEDNKFFKVLELLGVYQEKGSILLFVERQETSDSLFRDLLKKGYPCLSLHGGMDQFDRDSTIADFKNGVTRLMVSTSVAARGLDVKNLILVVNYDCPNHYEDYVHRVGRTGRAGNKGTSFTFVTPEQGRNAGDIIKAFELSKVELPESVLALWNLFREDMKKEGKTIKMNSGFSGKGFKFNAEEDAIVNESKKQRKFALGLQDSDDEAEAAETAMDKIEADLDKIFSSKPKVALQPEVVEAQKVKAAEQNVDKDKLKQASSIAALINKKLSSGQIMDRNTAATAHIMQGGALESLTGVGLAKQLADKVNAKLNYKAAEVEAQVAEKPAPVRYEEEIDINDFPQQARWRITSKEIIEQVRELSEAGVTVRGLYIPPNKKATEEEKRLHLYIESLSERSIQIAKAEIKRLLKEELIKAESNTYRPTQQTGRYKVL